MKISIVISALENSTTLGGHYFSAITTVHELAKRYQVELIIVGDKPSVAIQQSGLHYHFCPTPIGTFSIDRTSLLVQLRRSQPDVVIAFDVTAGMIVRPILVREGMGFIQVKAGGPPPRGYFPKACNQVHFSKTDAHWAKKRASSPLPEVSWIPNRVEPPRPDHSAVDQLRTQLKTTPEEIIIMRIGRIVPRYRAAFFGAIDLMRFLRMKGFPVRLVVVGEVGDGELHAAIQKQVSVKDAILTQAEHTNRAARLLPLGHINVGVGRGFMEGCAEGHWMLAMSENTTRPVVVSSENMMVFFEHNFSLRTRYSQSDAASEAAVVNLATRVMHGKPRCEMSREWYENYFRSTVLTERYEPLISSAIRYPETFSRDLIAGEVSLRLQGVKKTIRRLLRKS
jgi:hypothetical protein